MFNKCVNHFKIFIKETNIMIKHLFLSIPFSILLLCPIIFYYMDNSKNFIFSTIK